MPTTIRVYIDGGGTPAATGTMAADRTFSVPVSGVANGTHTLEVTAQEDGKGESARVIQTVEVSRGQIQHALAGDLSALASASADLTAPGAPSQQALAGDVAGAATATGDLTAPINLWGGATGTGASAADLTAPGAGGTAPFTDDFNRASLGSNYTALPGYSLPTISANRLGGGAAYISSRAFANDQYVEVYVPAWPATASEIVEAAIRASTSDQTKYTAAFIFDDGEWVGSVQLRKYGAAGAVTVLGSFTLDPLDPYLRVEAQGTTIRALTKASSGAAWGSAKVTATDSAIASGSGAVRALGGARIDDLVAGDL